MTQPNHYQVLSIAPDATQEEIDTAYRLLVRQYREEALHASDANERFTRARTAYHVLSDPDRRAAYAATLRLDATPATTPTTSSQGASTSGPPPIVVAADGSGGYVSISDAVAAHPAGSVIFVRPGIYHESLTVDHDVRLVGDGPLEEIIVQATGIYALRISAAGVGIANITFTGGLVPSAEANAIIVVEAGRLLMEKCVVRADATPNGIIMYGRDTDAVLQRCTIERSAGVGVSISDDATATLEECRILAHATAGVQIARGANPRLRQCIVRDAPTGVEVSEEGRGVLDTCRISACGNGVIVHHGGDPTLQRCRITDNERNGITIFDGGRGTYDACNIEANNVGLFIGDNGDPTMRQCTIIGNRDVAISAARNCHGSVEGCTLTGNTEGPWRVSWGHKLNRRWNRE